MRDAPRRDQQATLTQAAFLHDLAQPLVVLDGYLVALEGSGVLQEPQVTWLRQARTASAELHRLVEERGTRLRAEEAAR